MNGGQSVEATKLIQYFRFVVRLRSNPDCSFTEIQMLSARRKAI